MSEAARIVPWQLWVVVTRIANMVQYVLVASCLAGYLPSRSTPDGHRHRDG